MNNSKKTELIKLKEKDDEKGFSILLTNGPAKCYKDNKYIVPEYCLKMLDNEGISYEVINQ